ncbi:MBL fold metallo-hydrolase [Mycetocola manganoxydans]|uniref:MBL fold metallo-hydrolase n=1 Tax=Mycetocola manganoxydans TaxID=699879 RepID=A0A3L6ZWH9_9MICO|nr:MBL fold metallo-hydrolase [Mycetocola manganoxydans]RLP72376.1 MBL fold metallo-hydrolase [Mycetocola manganoxydans]GHD40674.1 MBL fold metallo-hydrolase [Mycetocola manganoxydans]
MSSWNEVADRVYQRRYDPLDVSVCVVAGSDGLLLVDTRCNPREAGELAADVAELSSAPIRWVANTHAHYDHSFGNQVFPDTSIFGHHLIARHFAEFEGPRLESWLAAPESQPHYDWRDVRLTPPTVPVTDVLSLDLGDRLVRFHPLPPGHTDTDLIVEIPDAATWLLGDVVEESGPPMYGSGSFPLGWPGVLDNIAELIAPGDVLVPGHGRPVDRAFLLEQAAVLHIVADGIRSSFDQSEPIESASERVASMSRLPLEIVESAVLRGYTQLAASAGASE